MESVPDLDRIKPDHAGDGNDGEPLATKDVNLPFAAPEKPGDIDGVPEGFLRFAADGFCFAHTTHAPVSTLSG